MNIYLVDFENVNESALEGIKILKSGDLVYIFHGEQLKSISLSITKEMLETKADIEFVGIHKKAKNYLDFQLSTFLGYLIGKGEKANFYIISKDTGFDSVIDFWKNRKISIIKQDSLIIKTVKQPSNNVTDNKKTNSNNINNQPKNTKSKESQPEISSKILPEEYREKLKSAIIVNNLSNKISNNDYEFICNAICLNKSKEKFNNALVKEMGNAKSSLIYKHIKSIFEDYRKNNSQ